MNVTKQFLIPKALVWRAYKLVKANKGAGGADQQSIYDFDKNLSKNLYKIWNRMSSGTYFPPPVKAVSIPKKNGGERILGIPTVSDRIAQMAVKLVFEPKVEPFFLPDSYGYRPNKSALDAIGVTRKRCWRKDWVLEFDIKGLFDNIDHALLMKAVGKHTSCKWVLLYIERWLKASMQMPDGSHVKRTKGTPQGGVISPILANLFLHYTFDLWMERNAPNVKWCRYADDGLLHCSSEKQAKYLLLCLKKRFEACGLEVHPSKTQIVYCKDDDRRDMYPNTSFDFLGYTFRPRGAKNKYGKMFISFLPGVSKKTLKDMTSKIRKTNLRNRTDLGLNAISKIYNPVLRGWMNYYGKYYPSALGPLWKHFNKMLIKWAMMKYRKLKGHKTRAGIFIEEVSKRDPKLFVHWEKGIRGSFA